MKKSFFTQTLPLLLIVFLAMYIRSLGVFHGQGAHPDERHIMMVVSDLKWEDPNPKSFAYGSFPFYLLKLAGDLKNFIAPYVPRCTNECSLTSIKFMFNGMGPYDYSFILGRFLSVLIGGLTALATFALSKKLFNNFWVAFLGTFFLCFNSFHIQLSHFYTVDTLLTLLSTTAFIPLINIFEKGRVKDYVLAAICIGLALATKISASYLVPILFISHIFHYRENFFNLLRLNSLSKLFLAVILVCITVFIAMPYAFLDYASFKKDILEQIRMVQGGWVPPYTIQYLKTLPYLYPLQQMFNYTMGWPIFILAWGGLFFSLTNNKNVTRLFAALWAVGLFLIIGKYQVKFPRYLLPIYPVLFIFAGYFLNLITKEIKNRTNSELAGLLPLFFIGYSIVSSLALTSIYGKEISYASASRWIYDNIPENATLGEPHWDDTLPITLPGVVSKKYNLLSLTFYESDSGVNNLKLASTLAISDYVVFPTQRIPASIPRNPEMSSFAGKTLSLMFNNNLGFEPIYVKKPQPKFGPFEFNDDLADESLSVYDHPKVVIFKNTGKLPADVLIKTVNETVQGSRLPTLEDIQQFKLANKPSYHNFIEIIISILLWVLAAEMLSLMIFPIVARALPSFPDLGFGLTKTLGTFLFGWLIFAGSALGIWEPTNGSVRIVFALLLAISIYSLRTTEYFFRFQIRNERRSLLAAEYLWLSIFVLFLIFRSFSPEIFWGEKPMDSTFLHYLTRYDSFPPGEPWGAGHTLRYYYLGAYIYAIFLKLTGIVPAIGFNLGLASVAACLVTALYSLTLFLCRSIKSAVIFALLIFFCTNFEVLRLTLFSKIPIGFDLFWASTRLFTSPGFTEYPLWSLLFADFHAHVIALPLTVVILAFLSKLLTYEYESTGERYLHRIILGVSLGILAGINTWDCITYSLLLVLILVVELFIELRIFFTFEKFIEVLQGWATIAISSFISALPMLFSILGNKKIGTGYVYPNEFNTLGEHFRMFGIWLIPIVLCFILHVKNIKKIKNIIGSVIVLVVCAIPIAYSLNAGITGHSWTILIFYSILAILSFLVLSCESLFIPGIITFFASFMLIVTELNFLDCRMNTIFKFLQPLWILLGVSALISVYFSIRDTNNRVLRCVIFLPLSICLMIGLAGGGLDCYIMTTFNRLYPDKKLTNRPTLDGQLYLNKYSPEEKALIDWFNSNVKGTPTILEAWGPSYREFGRITMHTGLPVVLGWDHHVSQRGISPNEIEERKASIAEIYNTTNLERALDLLKSYQVQYVVISEIETKNYKFEGLKKFADNPNFFEVVFNADKAKIFKVN